MSLFFDLLSSINNPNQQGSVSQLEGITNTIQQAAAERGVPASQLQSILSALGGFIGPALQQQGVSGGAAQLPNLLNQIAGGGNAATAIQSLFPPQVQQQLIQGIAQKTGISPNTLQGILPVVLPAVLGLLNMGASKSGAAGSNPLLNAFLNNSSAGTGANDLGEVFKFANRFLNPSPQ